MTHKPMEARSRAHSRRVRVEVIPDGREYISRSVFRPGLIHRITRTRDGWTCGCEGFRCTGCCQHLAQVEKRSEREGLPFGRIAPVA